MGAIAAALAASLPSLLPALAIVLATSLLVRHMQKQQQRQMHDGTYHPLPPSQRGWLPFWGLGLRFFQDVNLFLRQKHQEHGPEGPFRIYIMGKWWSFVYALEDVKLVLNSKDTELSFLEGFADLMKGMLPKGFTFVPRHHFFLPLFREPNMQWFHNLLAEEAENMVVPFLLRQSSTTSSTTNTVDLFDSCRHMVMRLNLRVLFGPLMLQDGRYEQYYDNFETIDPEKSLVDLMSSLFLGAGKKERAWASITELTKEVLESYQVKAKGGQTGRASPPECVLDLLVQKSDTASLDFEEVVGDTFAFVFASFTNTFAILAWAIYELAGNHAVRERFLAEARQLQQQKYDKDMSIKQIENLTVGKAVLDEVIRLKTPGLFFRKVVAPKGMVLSTGHIVPQGDLLAFSARYINTLPAFYQDPLAFDVNRYLDRNEKKVAGMYALQWGGGRHPCLGASFASLEILLVLRTLFSSCEVQRVTTTVEMSKSQLGTSDKPLQPVYVRVLVKKDDTTK